MKSGDPCPNCKTPLRRALIARLGMRALESTAIAIGLVAAVLNHETRYIDNKTTKEDRYINTKCRNCGETYPIAT